MIKVTREQKPENKSKSQGYSKVQQSAGTTLGPEFAFHPV